MKTGVIAIVGRPNVGKSTIFNRIAGERVSIVEDVPGVTRDRIYARSEWTGHEFRLIDTGGIQIADQPYQKEIQAQVTIAVEEADVIIFVVNGKMGLTDDDKYIARMLQKSDKPVVLAVNMIDDESRLPNIYEFYALGVGDPIAVSGVHGIGIGDILDACVDQFPLEAESDEEQGIRIAVIGEPNVGKSSLVNAILKEERAIVANEQGTTRDAVDTAFTYEGRPYVIVDTAPVGTVIDVTMRNAAHYATLTRERTTGHWGLPSEEISDDITLGRLTEANALTGINEFKVFPTATGLDKTQLFLEIKTNKGLDLEGVTVVAPIMENGKKYVLELDYAKLTPLMYITSTNINEWVDKWSYDGEVLNPETE